jgi:hemicentin
MSRLIFNLLFIEIFSLKIFIDVNECRQFQIDCGQDRTCFNTQGAYECIDTPCPVGYIRQNESDCLLKCYHRLSSLCSPRRAIFIRYRFIAIPRLTLSNQILFSLPITHQNKTSIKLIDKNNFNVSFPFLLDGINLKTNQTLIESHEYQFEIHLYNNELNGKHLSHHYRRRLHTIFVIQINVSPFHF